jgi:hypothetical protein
MLYSCGRIERLGLFSIHLRKHSLGSTTRVL